MTHRVLIIGGVGRIGRCVASDLLTYTPALVTLTGRNLHPPFTLKHRETYCSLDLENETQVAQAIQSHQLVIHCAGPFRDRTHHVLQTCIEQGIPYMDVADSPDYVKQALTYQQAAADRGMTAVVSTGVFPGISCSMVRQGIEQLDRADQIHLSYLVAGSGGAGVTVMRTTFIELQTPFLSKQQGQWQTIQPYSQREVIEFPHYGKGGVYWFNTIEAMTLAQSFPEVQTITTKFGSVPDYYNFLTWIVAQAPKRWLKKTSVIEFLSRVSYRMTEVTDRYSGIGISMRVAVQGIKANQPTTALSTFFSPDTAASAGQGAGMIAQLILEGKLNKPGVWPVEQVVSTTLFQNAMSLRHLKVEQHSVEV